MSYSSLSGRRRVRHDKEALMAAVPGYKVVLLGPMYLKINSDMIEEFQRRGNVPVPQTVRDGIIARHSKSGGATITGQMRGKGVWEATGPGATRTVDVVPRFKGTIFVDSRSKIVGYPPEFVGRKLDEIAHEHLSVPPPEPAVEPSSTSAFKSKLELEAELAGLEQKLNDAQESNRKIFDRYQQECNGLSREIAQLERRLGELKDRQRSFADFPPINEFDVLKEQMAPRKESLKQLIDNYDATVALLRR